MRGRGRTLLSALGLVAAVAAVPAKVAPPATEDPTPTKKAPRERRRSGRPSTGKQREAPKHIVQARLAAAKLKRERKAARGLAGTRRRP